LLDCDVLQADGGTRTAAITGSFIALVDALRVIADKLALNSLPLASQVAAVSVGKVGGIVMLDLCYSEDYSAAVDFNIVMNSRGEFVELQGSGEHGFFSMGELNEILRVAAIGLSRIFALQRDSLDLRHIEEDSVPVAWDRRGRGNEKA
jgi:ribonuclease PH